MDSLCRWEGPEISAHFGPEGAFLIGDRFGGCAVVLAADMAAAAAAAEDGEEKRVKLITYLAFCSCRSNWLRSSYGEREIVLKKEGKKKEYPSACV